MFLCVHLAFQCKYQFERFGKVVYVKFRLVAIYAIRRCKLKRIIQGASTCDEFHVEFNDETSLAMEKCEVS